MRGNHRFSLIVFSLSVILFTTALAIQAQAPKFKAGDRVEVDITHVDVDHGGNPAYQRWKNGTILQADTGSNKRYVIQLDPLPGQDPVIHTIPLYDEKCCIRASAGATPPVTPPAAKTVPPPAANGNTTAPQRGPAPAELPGTSWDLLSMTKKGETEIINQTTPNVQFCRDGSWAILHTTSSEGGKYQVEGTRIVMKTSDGALYGDYKITRNGNEMILDDGTWRLHLRYYGPVKC